MVCIYSPLETGENIEFFGYGCFSCRNIPHCPISYLNWTGALAGSFFLDQRVSFCRIVGFNNKASVKMKQKLLRSNEKPPQVLTCEGFCCTPGRNRTGTNSRSSVFETDASTNSATGAKWDCKGKIIPVKWNCNSKKFLMQVLFASCAHLPIAHSIKSPQRPLAQVLSIK